jgi:hypothetical protein
MPPPVTFLAERSVNSGPIRSVALAATQAAPAAEPQTLGAKSHRAA